MRRIAQIKMPATMTRMNRIFLLVLFFAGVQSSEWYKTRCNDTYVFEQWNCRQSIWTCVNITRAVWIEEADTTLSGESCCDMSEAACLDFFDSAENATLVVCWYTERYNHTTVLFRNPYPDDSSSAGKTVPSFTLAIAAAVIFLYAV